MTQPRLPQFSDYQHIGAYMRDLRLYYALDVPQVAERLHIRAKYIQAIEEGRLEQMPGKVYARGYIVTYAEFLGLDAEAIATQYLGEGAGKARDMNYFVPEPKRVKLQRAGKRMPYGALAALVVAGLAYAYWPTGESEAPAAGGVQDVPEAMLNAMRNGLMPVAGNAECLLGKGKLACVERMGEAVPGAMFVEPMTVLFVDAAKVKSLEPEPELAVEEVEVVAPKPEEAKPAAPAEERKPEPVKQVEKPAPKAEPKKEEKEPEAKTPEKEKMAEEFVPEAPVEAPKPEDAVMEEEAKPAALLPSGEWLQRGLESAVVPDDPNAPRQEPWSPRGRR